MSTTIVVVCVILYGIGSIWWSAYEALRRAATTVRGTLAWAHMLSALLVGVSCVVASLCIAALNARDHVTGVIQNVATNYWMGLAGGWLIVASLVGL